MPTKIFPSLSEAPSFVEDAGALWEIAAEGEGEVDVDSDPDELVVVIVASDVVEPWLGAGAEVCDVVLSGAELVVMTEVDLDDNTDVLFLLEVGFRLETEVDETGATVLKAFPHSSTLVHPSSNAPAHQLPLEVNQ